MVTATEHYACHLAPIYLWMAGGMEAAIERGGLEIDSILCSRSKGGTAVDLGAGFGMHTIPLAHRGYSVLAIDSSSILLELLRSYIESMPVRIAEDDLLTFRKHSDSQADLILCMGDTLTHLSDLRSVEQLFSSVTAALRPGGQFVTTFRDYTSPLVEENRFIPVRSDNDRILTCFLDYSSEHVAVHDLLHERNGSTWQLRVSAYRKLRIPPDWVATTLQSKGFAVRVEPGLSGMVRVVGEKG